MTTPQPLQVESFAGAVVVPFEPFVRRNGRRGIRMGVFDERDRVVPASLLTRSYGKVGFAAEFTAATRTAARSDPREVIYAGRLTRHFGHFTLESLARLWYAGAHPELPIAWAWHAGKPSPAYSGWQQDLLEVLGIRNEAIFVAEPARFDVVHVPQAGYRIKDLLAPQQAEFLAAYPPRQRDPRLRAWLSRTRVDPGVLHAPRLEAVLSTEGWTVVHPETLPIREQLELLATAGHVAGEEGSAFHLLALLADVQGLRVDIFCRHPNRTVEEQNANYQTIAEVRNLDQRLHVMSDELLISEDAAHVTKLATTLAGHLEVLGVFRPSEPAVPSPAGAVLAALASRLGARSSLELMGPAADPLALDIPRRHIVSPHFASDPRLLSVEGAQLFELPPREFFAYLADAEDGYDLVLLAGPDAASDFEASQRYATERTVWLIQSDVPLSGELRGRTVSIAGELWSVVLGPSVDESVVEALPAD